jgi:hypothetical protein
MKKIFSIVIIAAGICVSHSCTKEGLGGDTTLVVFLQHHTKTIINRTTYLDTVYLKFNSKDLPGTKPSDFDTFFVGEAGEDHVHCKGLKTGDYYLYGAGYDTTIPARVVGGMHVKIKYKDRKNEVDVNLAVTE